MKSKYSITDDDHVYYDIMSKSDLMVESFVDWISVFYPFCEVDGNLLKIKNCTVQLQLNREGVVSVTKGNTTTDFWWNPNTENTAVKEKIKALLK